jgi:hypothetical protein
MKAMSLVCLFISIVLFCVTAASAAGTGCYTSGADAGTRGDKIFYTDCFDWVSGDGYLDNGFTNNDHDRLQRAIDAATKDSLARGKLIFNEDQYFVDGTLILRSYSVLEGLGSAANKSTGIQIRLMETEDNTSLFSIGSGIHDVAIRDLGLVYYWVGAVHENPPSSPNSIAIKAEGANISTPNSTGFQFDHLRIAYFTKGIYVNSSGDGLWQFDNNHIQDSNFELCQTAIHLNTGDTGWHMNNIVFVSGEGQNGLYIQKVGYININLMVGDGTYNEERTERLSNEFIKIEKHGFVNIQNANGEGYKKTLIIDTPYISTPGDTKGHPVVIANSDLQECHYTEGKATKSSVVINNGTLISQGNSFACDGKVARPEVEGMAEVYSTGDIFCYPTHSECFDTSAPYLENSRSGWAIQSRFALVRTDGVNNRSGSTDDFTRAFVDLTATYHNDDLTGPYKPFLSLTDSYYDPTSDAYLKYRYTIARNQKNGRLMFDADLNGAAVSPPSAGYQFKGGPVQLERVPVAYISAGYYNIAGGGDAGSMLYCYDCTAGSSPCAGSGGGALAVKIESGSWACK